MYLHPSKTDYDRGEEAATAEPAVASGVAKASTTGGMAALLAGALLIV